MRKKPIIALMLTVSLLFTVVGPVMASAFEPFDFNKHIRSWASGVYSDNIVYQTVVDAVYLPNGTVTTSTYIDGTLNPTINTFQVTPQSNNSGSDKMTRFVFELSNRYRPQSQIAIMVSPDRQAVSAFVYGEQKTEAMYAFVSGLKDCLDNAPYAPPTSGSTPSNSGSSDKSTWIDKYSPDVVSQTPITTFQITSFTINKSIYTMSTTDTTDNVITPTTTQTMDVAPYIKDDRTYVPVRYLAYSLGVPESGITWDGDTRRVGISKDDANVVLLIGSPYIYVNKKPIKMDVAPEITNNRTFLPARWVAEALGAEVAWDDTAKQAIIKMPIKEPGD